jgi:hypothetical protein
VSGHFAMAVSCSVRRLLSCPLRELAPGTGEMRILTPANGHVDQLPLGRSEDHYGRGNLPRGNWAVPDAFTYVRRIGLWQFP